MYLLENTLLHGGTYRIIRFISAGGFGCTYEAEHVMLRKRVAIKEFFVKDFCNRDENTSHVTLGTLSKKALVDKLRKKFLEEAKGLSRLRHPGIVSVSDVFEENGTAYFVMDYVDGKSLGDMVKEEGFLSEKCAVGYIKKVSDALRYVHENNRLHLDLKPGNIMVDSNDNPILIDFGASKQYDEEGGENTSTLMGKTPGYAPPEQMSNSVMLFLPATDIYALGATLYKLLTGITPVDANMRISGDELQPLPATISEPTRNAVMMAMHMNKHKRPQTIDQFLGLLNGSVAPASIPTDEVEVTVLETKKEEPVEQKSAPKPEKPSEPEPKKKRSLLPILIAAVVVIGALVGYFAINSDKKEETVIANNLQEPFEENKRQTDEEQAQPAKEDNATDSLAIIMARKAEEERLAKEKREREAAEKAEAERKAKEQTEKEPQDRVAHQYNLGVKYYDAKDYSQAVYWYTKAAEQGYAPAQNNLGICYENGHGVAKDYSKAVYWYTKAAEQGDAMAQYNLGIFYDTGQGVSIDYSKAVYWWTKAAEQGYTKAQYNLGYCYDTGHGVAKDYSKAVYWYTKAAEQGFAKAQGNLGICYYFGQGVSIDYSKAVYWLTKAAEQGDANAKTNLEILRKMGY